MQLLSGFPLFSPPPDWSNFPTSHQQPHWWTEGTEPAPPKWSFTNEAIKAPLKELQDTHLQLLLARQINSEVYAAAAMHNQSASWLTLKVPLVTTSNYSELENTDLQKHCSEFLLSKQHF